MALQPIGIDSTASCARSLDIAWINLDRRTDKANYMTSMLSSSLAALAADNRSVASSSNVSSIAALPCINTRRFAALGATCADADAPCIVSSDAPISNASLASLETSYLKSQAAPKRQGLLGCWLSHLALLRTSVRTPC